MVASFAEVAAEFKYVRPVISESPVLRITEGRHPVIERTFAPGAFVANDVKLGGENAPEIALITGCSIGTVRSRLRIRASWYGAVMFTRGRVPCAEIRRETAVASLNPSLRRTRTKPLFVPAR